MIFNNIEISDLEEIRSLQVDGWPDMIPDFEFYIKSQFCYPVKTEINGKIVGIGTAIKFQKTGWLAHIIVDTEYRNQGIGYEIVNELLRILKNFDVESYQLIATNMGKPVYMRAGFREVTEYAFFKKEIISKEKSFSENIKLLSTEYISDILKMDLKISGENRAALISHFLNDAVTYAENGKLTGYYLPSLKEGPICAETVEAGIELMKYKYSKADKAVLPSDNQEAIKFLKENGFVESGLKGTRMILGKSVNWKPENIFSRIGGNFG